MGTAEQLHMDCLRMKYRILGCQELLQIAVSYFQDKDTCDMYQVWYDNPISLTYKYERALALGLRGVGAWEADSLDYSAEESTVMWEILPSGLWPGSVVVWNIHTTIQFI